jgi:predicted ATP-dependent endonuclease of OLD family
MWRKVELENYRSIERASVELAPFTVLVGPNGSGKSSFADALVLVRDVASGDAALAIDEPSSSGSFRSKRERRKASLPPRCPTVRCTRLGSWSPRSKPDGSTSS